MRCRVQQRKIFVEKEVSQQQKNACCIIVIKTAGQQEASARRWLGFDERIEIVLKL